VFSDGDGNLKWVERDASTPVRQFNINDVNGQKGRSASANNNRGNPVADTANGDIVQRILPTTSPSLLSPPSNVSTPELGTQNLAVWTGDGKLGMVTFGREDVFDEDTFEDALERQVDGEDADMRAMEKEYSLEMRKALEQQAREVRWLRGYGL
jgi:hypothetical protein